MALGDDRWIEVSKSAFPHEQEGLDLLRYVLPDAAPYRAWSNFEFLDNHGQWHEVDALVLGRRRLHLIELKHFQGVLRGDENNWVRTLPSGAQRTQRSPLLITRRKAQRLATRLEEKARQVAIEMGMNPHEVRRALPFIQESVFLHASDFRADLPTIAMHGLFGADGFEDETNLPGIASRVLEPPSQSRPMREDLELIVVLALKELGVARRTTRDAGSWTITGPPLATGDDWQERLAHHKSSEKRGIARIVSFAPGTPTHSRAAAHRRMSREFSLLSALRHESIVAPEDLVQDDDGNTVLIYPVTEGLDPLDLVLVNTPLTAAQQLDILSQVAEALAYAHRNRVAHRGLGPSSVLIDAAALTSGTVSVKLVDWSWAGRIHSDDTTSVTTLGNTNATSGAADTDEVFQAPEERWSPDADRLALDIFSLGALAYFLLSGGQRPAHTRAGLLSRLQREQGLDLAAESAQFVDEQLRQLILRLTDPSVSRRVGIDPKTKRPTFGAQQVAAALADYRRDRQPSGGAAADPLSPPIGAVLADRFEVHKLLGSGSTARGILVTDRRDDVQRVLKVGRDDAAATRLHDEADVLTALARQSPPVPGVVELIEGPLQLGERTALLLSDCGEQTLADVVRFTALAEAQLKAWGTDLLDALTALDAAGLTHRDIKPSNLGLTRAEDRRIKYRLTLFDFSLSRAPVDQLDAGTPPYRDPFLGSGRRTAYDSAAERYAAAVVLYEMATSSTPAYGDGMSDPRVLTDDVAVVPEDFGTYSRTRAEALAAFFRTALARDTGARFDTTAAMRSAWLAVFTAKRPAAPASVTTGNTALPPASPPAAPRPTGGGDAAEPYTSLEVLAVEFAKAAAAKPQTMRRQVTELILGSRDDAPDDPFVTYQVLVPLLDVTAGRIAQIFGEFPTLWTKNPRLAATVDQLHGRIVDFLASTGGVSTPDLLARELVGALTTADPARAHRTGLGVLRLILASQASGTESALRLVRRQSTGSVAMIASASVPPAARRLPAALAQEAQRLLSVAEGQGLQLVGAADAVRPLQSVTAGVFDISAGQVEIPGYVLLRLAADSSTEVTLSARDELHSPALPIADALRLVLTGLSQADSFSPKELRSRLAARFPQLSKRLPARPELDDLIATVAPGMSWLGEIERYGFADAQSRYTHVPTHKSFTGTPAVRETSTTDLDRVLRESLREPAFRAFGVPMHASDQVAAALVAQFGATHIDVTELLLTELHRRADQQNIAWDQILAADAGAAADREGLQGFVAQAVPTLVDAVRAVDGPVVLTDLSTLAAYGQLGVLQEWVDISHHIPHPVWALIPQPAESGGAPGAVVDGTTLPRSTPAQFVLVDEPSLRALLTRERITSKENA